MLVMLALAVSGAVLAGLVRFTAASSAPWQDFDERGMPRLVCGPGAPFDACFAPRIDHGAEGRASPAFCRVAAAFEGRLTMPPEVTCS